MPIAGRPRAKTEQKLAEHVKKALSTAETAPKQKHVRACIVYTWEFQSSQLFWQCLRMHPVLSDQVVCYKALIAVHKVLTGGPHVVLSEALGKKPFFDSCIKQHGSITLGYGYGPLIAAYCEFLLDKLEFHRSHPEFTGNFDYEEYISLKGIANLDEGYQTIERLMELQDKVDRFQRTVFLNVRYLEKNECRIASLVPLIEESHGIYKFITSMLSAMHLCVESPDPLILLVEKYNSQFYALKKFYQECEKIRYLTSLVEIPQLPDEPPKFDLGGPAASRVRSPEPVVEKPPIERRKSPPADLLGDFDDISNSESEDDNLMNGTNSLEQVNQFTHTVTTVPVADSKTLEALRMAQMQVNYQGQQLQDALYRQQQDQSMINQMNQQIFALRQQVDSLSSERSHNQVSSDAVKYYEDQIAKLRAEIEEWKGKYEAMSKEAARWKSKFEGMSALYQQLREEHLEALRRIKERQEGEASKQAVEEEESNMTAALGDHLASELLKVCQAIEAAAQRLEDMKTDPSLAKLSSLNSAVHSAIVDGASSITSAIGNLIKYAIKTQEEIVAAGKGSGTPEAFYKKHSQWTNGLISAAQTVAAATMTLVETADGVIKGTRKIQHLVAASNNVAAATMQLVTASRVKAPSASQGQPLLERAAKAVTDANRRLVDSAAAASGSFDDDKVTTLPDDVFSLKVEELERQAKVLSLEKELSSARGDLAMVRKAAYSKQSDAVAVDGNGNNNNSSCASGAGSSGSKSPALI